MPTQSTRTPEEIVNETLAKGIDRTNWQAEGPETFDDNVLEAVHSVAATLSFPETEAVNDRISTAPESNFVAYRQVLAALRGRGRGLSTLSAAIIILMHRTVMS